MFSSVYVVTFHRKKFMSNLLIHKNVYLTFNASEGPHSLHIWLSGKSIKDAITICKIGI